MSEPMGPTRVAVAGASRPAFQFPYSQRRQLAFGVGCLALCAIFAAVLLLADGGERVWGGIGTLLFGAGGLFLLHASRGGNRVALTPDGVTASSSIAEVFVPWSAITGVSLDHAYANTFVAIDVSDPSLIRTSGWLAPLKGLNRTMAFSDLTFPTGLLGDRAPLLLAALATYWKLPDRRAAIGQADEWHRLLEEAREVGAPDSAEGGTAAPEGRPFLVSAAAVLLMLGGAFFALVALGTLLDAEDRSDVIGGLLFLAGGLLLVAGGVVAWQGWIGGRVVLILGTVVASLGCLLFFVSDGAAGPRMVLGAVLLAMAGAAGWLAGGGGGWLSGPQRRRARVRH